MKGKAIEEGNYILRLLGAKPDTYQPDALAFDFVVDEGGYKNRRIFPTLPNPGKHAWAANAAKHLATQLNVTQEPGESIPAMFNRIATTGQARIQARVVKESFTRSNGEAGEGNKLQFFTAQAVA